MNEKIKEVFELALKYFLGYRGATYVTEKRVKYYIKSKSEEYEFQKSEVEPCLYEINQTLTSDLIYNADRHRYYFQNEYDAEKKIIDYLISQEGKISDRDFTRHIKSAQRAGHIKYSEEQETAISTAFHYKLSAITGGPGTGKTTVIRGIYYLAGKLGYDVRIFAPTGKAAMRIQQATELFATTIHKGLTEDISSSDKNLIIIDEASMIDSYLMSLIIEHWGMFTIVLIGDVNQLPSVSNGEVLFDIIHSGKVAVTYLSQGYRSEETIVTNANMSLRNMLVKDWKYNASFRFIPVKFRITDKQLGLYDIQINRFKEVVYRYWRHLTDKYDIQDVIILLPLKKEDVDKERFITSDTVNEYIQSMRFRRIEEEYKYYNGDRVIYTQNRYDIFDENGYNLFNGMTGTVTGQKEDGWLKIKFDNGSEFTLHEDDENLELAYALTVHKAQGSEYKSVIFVAMNFYVTNRCLFYTAITRTMEQVIILGRYDLLSHILNIKNNYRRTTFLKESFSIQEKETYKKIAYEDDEKWNDECLVYDKNYFAFPSDEYGLENQNNHIIKSDALAGGVYSHDFTKNEMKVMELYFASINIGDAATRFQEFELKRMNVFQSGRISEAHVLEMAEKFRNLYINLAPLFYNKKGNSATDEWPYVKISESNIGKKYLKRIKFFDVCEWDNSKKKFILQISDELIPFVFQIQPITGYIKGYPLEFVDRMSPKDVLLFNYFRRHLGKSLIWTYERLSKIFRLEPGSYNTISDFNKFFRELNKSIAANTDMQITFEDYPEKGKNGHLYHKYKIDIFEKPIEIAIDSMPYSDDEIKKDTNLSLQSVSVVSEIHPVIRRWEKCVHEITGTEYLRLGEIEKSIE